jgi:hypothetical protein
MSPHYRAAEMEIDHDSWKLFEKEYQLHRLMKLNKE